VTASAIFLVVLLLPLALRSAAEAGGPSAPPMPGPSSSISGPQSPLFQNGTYLVVDVTPPDAEVYLDGRWLGAARTLSRGQIPILPGKHTLTVLRPGYRAYVAGFIARPVGIPTRLRVVLLPD